MLAVSLRAAEFHTGQAARAVIGQPSFSAREPGIAGTALTIVDGKLYAADAAHRILTFDLNRIPGAKDDLSDHPAAGACPLCGFAASTQVNQQVLPGVAGVSVFGDAVAIVDTANHRALFWPKSSNPDSKPIVIGSTELTNPISIALDAKRLFIGDAALRRVFVWNSFPLTDNQAADAVLGQIADSPAADSISRPAALASDGANLFVADNLDRRILVFTAADTVLPRNAVVNSASLAPGPLAPGTLVTISGIALSESSAAAPDDDGQALPLRLAGTEVFLNGISLPLLSVSANELRAQLPYDIGNAAAASVYVRIEHADGTVTTTAAAGLKIIPASPGLFAFNGAEPRTGMILHSAVSAQEPPKPVTSDDPARPGELLTLWAAGLGAVDTGIDRGPVMGVPYADGDAPVLSPVAALAGERSAEVVSAVLPHGGTGVYEIRVLLPEDLPSDAQTKMLVMQDGVVSNTITVPVRSRYTSGR